MTNQNITSIEKLVPVFDGQIGGHNVKVCNARDLHSYLENGDKFADWIKVRIEKYQFEENQDFVSFSVKTEKPAGGRPAKEYHLTLGTAKELAMVENNQRGRDVVLNNSSASLLGNITAWTAKKIKPLFAALMLSNPITSYSNEIVPTTNEQAESGSLEAIAETPFRTRDDYTGSTMVIYPSVLNETRVAKGNFSALRFYIAPLCVIIIPDKFKTFTGRTSNEVMYSFEMLNFHPQMELQAKQYVTEQLQSSTDSKFKATGGNISRLTHQQVTFKLPDFPAIKIDPIGTVFEDRSLNDTLKLNMYVPINDKARFEEMVQAGSVNMDVKIYYIGKNVKIASMSWSAAELKNTEAYKKIDSSGAQFVNAQQLDDMVRETVQRKDITIFQDPGIPEQLTAKVQNMFDKFLNIQGEDAMFIKNRDEARQIEKEILTGTGLTAEEFKPITMMWEITNELKDSTDFKTANKKIQEYMNKETNRDKFSASVSAGYGPFSGSLGYEKEMTQERVNKGYFESQDEFNKFSSKHHTERGMEPRITPRGLNLVETKKFKDNLSMTASAVAYYPVDKTRQLGITGAFVGSMVKPEPILNNGYTVVSKNSSGDVIRRFSVLSFQHPDGGYLPGEEWAERYYHIKTPNKLKGSEMWRYDLKGYSYGIGQPLDFTWVGYYYTGNDEMNNNSAINRMQGSSVKVTQYTSTDGYLVLKFGPINQYYNSFTLDYQSGSTGERSNHNSNNYSVLLTKDDIKL